MQVNSRSRNEGSQEIWQESVFSELFRMVFTYIVRINGKYNSTGDTVFSIYHVYRNLDSIGMLKGIHGLQAREISQVCNVTEATNVMVRLLYGGYSVQNRPKIARSVFENSVTSE